MRAVICNSKEYIEGIEDAEPRLGDKCHACGLELTQVMGPCRKSLSQSHYWLLIEKKDAERIAELRAARDGRHVHACKDHPDRCLSRGWCECECGATMPTQGSEWEPAVIDLMQELKKSLAQAE